VIFVTRVLLLVAIPLLVSGSLAEDSLRRGNAAYERGDYDRAAAAYVEAEARTTDPGLAAFNKAAALYQRGHFRDAELSYRCSLEDAAGPRRTFALYGLGSALVQQGRERGREVLHEAIRCYEECLRQPDVSAELADDARHDIELAKLLAQLVPPKSNDKPNSRSDDEEDKPKPPPERRQSPDPGMEPFGQGKADARAEKQRVGREQAKDAEKSDEGTAGAGTLPPVPDREELAPMSRDDAQEHLKRAAARVLSEQRAHARHKRLKGDVENGLDW
jgi:tetratricopeptide (TPR) repeat protein